MPEVRAQIIITAKDQAGPALSSAAKEAKRLGDEAKTAAKKAEELEKAQKRLGDASTKAGLALLAGGAAMVAGLKFAIDEAAEAEKVFAQTEAVIKSTGGAAGLTAREVADMAGALQKASTFGDEAILTGQNLLLTFTNIGKDVFPMASQAMVDMATAMGTDVSSGAIQLGKALNDPIKGITALTRVGVSFTAEQKALIASMTEAGDVAGAQKIILAELAKEFGGSAAAAVNTFAGQQAQLKNEIGELAEAIGSELLPRATELIGIAKDAVAGINEMGDATRAATTEILLTNTGIVLAAGSLLVAIPRVFEMAKSARELAAALKLVQAAGGVKGMLAAAGGPLAIAAAVGIGTAIKLTQDFSLEIARNADKFAEQEAQIRATAPTWENYQQRVKAAALELGFLIDAQGNLVKVGAHATRTIIATDVVVTQAERSAAAYGSRLQAMADHFSSLQPKLVEHSAGLNSTGQHYRDLAANIAEVGEASRIAAEKMDMRQGLALQAGLAGDLTAAHDAYQDVIRATQPEIDKLNSEIERYESLQGKAVTVTTEATTNAKEYRLAAIEAAEAQQKVTEYTGDSEKELLKLELAAEAAQQKVAALGEGMGITSTYTLDYTSKLAQLNGSLNNNVAKQLAAEEQLRLTTAQFLFQQLAVEGDHAANLELARSLGLLDEPSYAAATAALALKEAYEDGAFSAETFGVKAGDLAAAIAALQDRHITITVDTIQRQLNIIQYQEEAANRNEAQDAEDAYYNGQRAFGGPVSPGNSYLVGERGPEVFRPHQGGTIVPNGGSGNDEELKALIYELPGMLTRAMTSAMQRSRR